MANPEQDIPKFLRHTEASAFPIDPEDVISFVRAVQFFNPPERWTERVLSSLQYVDKSTFEKDLDKMALQFFSSIGEKPYAAMLSEKGKSDYWIYEQLQKRGVPQSQIQCDFEMKAEGNVRLNQLIAQEIDSIPNISDLSIDEQVKAKGKIFHGRANTVDEWISSLPQEYPICVFDDFSVSGTMILDELLWLPHRKQQQSGRLHVFICYASELAWKRFVNHSVTVHQSGQTIKLLSSSLTPEDIDFANKLDREVTKNKGGLSDSSNLFWTWYKVPDNLPGIFIGDGLPPLIRPEKFQPPYKSAV